PGFVSSWGSFPGVVMRRITQHRRPGFHSVFPKAEPGTISAGPLRTRALVHHGSMENPDHDSPAAATAEPRNAFLEEKAFKSRTVLLFGAISDSSASDIARRLIALDADSSAPIDMIVSSPGGHLESGDAIHDLIRFIAAPVNMVGTGWVGSAATHLYLS